MASIAKFLPESAILFCKNKFQSFLVLVVSNIYEVFIVFFILNICLMVFFFLKTISTKKDSNEQKKLISSIYEGQLATIQNTLNDINDILPQYKKCPLENFEGLIPSKIISSEQKYYEIATESKNKAKDYVYSTYYADHDHNTSKVEAIEYFKNDLKFCNTNPDVVMRRIMTIHNNYKLDMCKSMIDRMKLSSNFFLAYLNVPSFNNFRLGKMPVGMQVFDDEVIIMNPESARNVDPFKNHIYVKSKDIAQIYKEYHEELWNAIADDTQGLLDFNQETTKIRTSITVDDIKTRRGLILKKDDQDYTTPELWEQIRLYISQV